VRSWPLVFLLLLRHFHEKFLWLLLNHTLLTSLVDFIESIAGDNQQDYRRSYCNKGDEAARFIYQLLLVYVCDCACIWIINLIIIDQLIVFLVYDFRRGRVYR